MIWVSLIRCGDAGGLTRNEDNLLAVDITAIALVDLAVVVEELPFSPL